MARVRTLLRRPRPSTATAAEAAAAGRSDGAPRVFGDLVIDVVAREVTVDGRRVELTKTEFDLLDTLSERPRVAFPRSRLLELVWGGADWADEHLVDVHIGHLRHKLGDDARRAKYVRTIRSVGYRMGEG